MCISPYGSLSSSLATKNFFIFTIRSLHVVCSSSFSSKFNITLSNAYSLCTRTEASFQTFFFMSTSGMNWCSTFCCCEYGKHKPWHGSLEYIQFLNGYNWTICHPFYRMPPRHWRHRLEVDYSNKDQFIPILFGIVLVWIATKQTIGTNVKMGCLVIVTKRCHATPLFPSADCKYTPWTLE